MASFRRDARALLWQQPPVTPDNLKIKEVVKFNFDKLSAGRHLGSCHDAMCSEVGSSEFLKLLGQSQAKGFGRS